MQELKILYFRESLLQSIIADISSYGFLLLTYWLNYRFIEGNNFVDFILLIIFCIFTSAKVSGKKQEFTSWKQMQDFIKKEMGDHE